jgi:hypothetical protein
MFSLLKHRNDTKRSAAKQKQRQHLKNTTAAASGQP